MFKKIINSKLTFAALLILILMRPTLFILENRESFFSRNYSDRYPVLQKAYSSSQYVKKKNPAIIPDEAFEEFAAGFFLKGNNPILIVHDHPPLGRYLLSFSIVIFDNAKTMMVILFCLTILALFLIGKKVLHNSILTLIPIGIFVNEPLFFNKLVYAPLPEPIQLPFILFALYFFIKALQSRKYWIWLALTSLMIGMVISSRFFVTGVVLTTSLFAVLMVYKKLRRFIFPFVLTLPISLVVLFITYTKSIFDSGSILEPIKIQKYIFFYHKSKFVKLFSFWDLILFNRWHTWWGTNEIIRDTQWMLCWPISVVLTIVFGMSAVFKKLKLSYPESVLFSWLLFYSLMLSTGYTSTRYFLPILPILYILSVSFIIKMYQVKYKKK